MIKVFKVLVIITGLTLTFAASTMSYTDITIDTKLSSELLLPDNLYACSWWPICKDPEQKSPVLVPIDSSTPKPNGDTDPGKDKKDQAQLA